MQVPPVAELARQKALAGSNLTTEVSPGQRSASVEEVWHLGYGSPHSAAVAHESCAAGLH